MGLTISVMLRFLMPRVTDLMVENFEVAGLEEADMALPRLVCVLDVGLVMKNYVKSPVTIFATSFFIL